MQLYRKGSHTVYDIKYHIVWSTKYRKPVLSGKLGKRVRDLIREICDANNVQILRGHVSKDHIHVFVSVPPQLSASHLTQLMKGKTARKILQEFPELQKRFWGKHFWSRGYFVASSGAITDEMVMHYLEHQDEDEDKRGDGFTILEV